MRKAVYSMMVSLDGFVETPDRDLNWVVINEELHKYINERHRQFDTDGKPG